MLFGRPSQSDPNVTYTAPPASFWSFSLAPSGNFCARQRHVRRGWSCRFHSKSTPLRFV